MLLKTRMLMLLASFLVLSACSSKDKCRVDFRPDFELLENGNGVTKACFTEEALVELKTLIRKAQSGTR